MKLVWMHYHLNAGGVTRVIENHLLSLDATTVAGGNQETVEATEVYILVGNGDNALPADLQSRLQHVQFTVDILPELSYDGCLDHAVLAQLITERLHTHGLHADNALLHIHNHALGKNLALPQALRHLSQSGFRMLLQLHDFIEDFRPQNYHKMRSRYVSVDEKTFINYLYPQSHNIHYCVLNSRDYAILKHAGIGSDRLDLLPNPVDGDMNTERGPAAKKHWAEKVGCPVPHQLILYPVRGITRKNIGELLLHACLADPGRVYALTLSPQNPIEKDQYDQWVQLADELALPCYFDVGRKDGLSFADNVAASDAIISTSVAEGFGMVFLEPWLMGRPVIGRDLSEITADFKANGVHYDGLYDRFPIPIGWVGEDEFCSQWAHSYSYALRTYGGENTGIEQLKEMARAQIYDNCIDFALLTMGLQKKIITLVQADSKRAQVLKDLLQQRRKTVALVRAADNVETIREHYSFETIGVQLRGLYEKLLSDSVGDYNNLHDAPAVLSGFFDSKRFYPLRVSACT